MIKPRFKTGSQEHDTTVEIDDVEVEVVVVYSIQPPEPDVGIDGGIEIENVLRADTSSVMDKLSEDQLDSLAYEINDYNVSSWEDYR